MADALERFNFQTEEDLYAAIGYGEVTAQSVANRLTEKERKEREKVLADQEAQELLSSQSTPKNESKQEKMKLRQEGGIAIEGVDNLLVRISRCCNPVPGDEIVGYITKGRGVSIHRKDCPNIKDSKEASSRLIDVEWENPESVTGKEYAAELEIYGYNRSGFLNDILQLLNSVTKNLMAVEAKPTKDKTAVVRVLIAIKSLQQLESIVNKIKNIPDVYSVRRTNS